jgi:hypothetical protein
MTAFLVDNEVHSGTSLAGESQAFDALRHQYVAELLRREKIFTETFVPDGSHPSGQRMLGQIDHPREIKSNSEYDARVSHALKAGLSPRGASLCASGLGSREMHERTAPISS